MSEQSPLRKLADELDALAGSDEGTAYGIYHDENMVEVVADRDALVFLAAAFARTATFAESEPGARRTGPFTVSAFKNGSDLSIWFPTYDPAPAPPREPESSRESQMAFGALTAGCLITFALAVVGLVAILRWAL